MTAISSPAAFLLSVLCLPQSGLASVSSRANVDAADTVSLRGVAKAQSVLTPLASLRREQMYSTNSLCRRNYCTNPVFPGINDLPRLEALPWQCATTSMARPHMEFCKDAVNYDPALPSPASKPAAVNELVKAQEEAAMTMFVYHLSGMGYEAWDHQDPSASDDNCVRSVWKMVCFTYFPRAEAGCKVGELSRFKRPCKSSCQNYIQQCGVECCDESVQCAFTHTSYNKTGQLQLLQTGYVDENGPSAMCTGSARRFASFPLMLLLGVFGLHWGMAQQTPHGIKTNKHPRRSHRWLLLTIVGMLALCLQGCEEHDRNGIATHTVANWRALPSYLNEFKYLPHGSKNVKSAVLNSCSQGGPATEQCNGRGYCRIFSLSGWTAKNPNPITFCQCDMEWADPECGTKRKSQATAFFWSLFLGFVGADYFYLGFPLAGVAKLVTLGGLGFWWLIDIVRIASGPVYAYNYRTANDLPHWVAILVMISTFLFVGFFLSIKFYFSYRQHKRQDLMHLQHSEEARSLHRKHSQEHLAGFGNTTYQDRHGVGGHSGFSGYGAMLPQYHPNMGSHDHTS